MTLERRQKGLRALGGHAYAGAVAQAQAAVPVGQIGDVTELGGALPGGRPTALIGD